MIGEAEEKEETTGGTTSGAKLARKNDLYDMNDCPAVALSNTSSCSCARHGDQNTTSVSRFFWHHNRVSRGPQIAVDARRGCRRRSSRHVTQ